MTKSGISWTEKTINPITGCDYISYGCKYCYAKEIAHRFKTSNIRFANDFEVTLHPDIIDRPLKRKKPTIYFINSMSDIFHKNVPLEYIQRIFAMIEKADWHIFQFLTKRSSRMVELAPQLPWPNNLWAGVTIESGKYAHRADNLRKVPAAVRFASFEPLLGRVDNVDLSKIDWAIAGGESGPRAREMKKEWVVDLRDRCISLSIPFHFKQWGTFNKSETGRELDGKIWDEFPESK